MKNKWRGSDDLFDISRAHLVQFLLLSVGYEKKLKIPRDIGFNLCPSFPSFRSFPSKHSLQCPPQNK